MGDPRAGDTVTLGKVGYAALFLVGLPLALARWAVRLDELVRLPAVDVPQIGWVLAAFGVALMVAGTMALWRHGGGLPMSPYPPSRYVVAGIYRYLRHPLYVGAVALAAGLSLAWRSPAGLWVITPTLAAGVIAWVVGFEHAATTARFGVLPTAWLTLPPAVHTPPTPSDRWSVYLLLLLPWLLLYEAVEFLGVPPDAVSAWQAWDAALPVLPWTEALYLLAYPLVLAVPWCAATRADLRTFVLRGWVAMAIILPLYLLVPLVAEAKPVPGDGMWVTLMRWERLYDAPVTAVPAFHVVWTMLATAVVLRRWPRSAPLGWLLVLGVSASCVAVGMHATLDVVTGLAIGGVLLFLDRWWEALRRMTERIANSWHEWRVGPVRLINHGLYAALGGTLGLLAMLTLAGPAQRWPLLGFALAAVLGAALWAQWIEGSPQLLRPYGYFGSVVGSLFAVAVAQLAGADIWPLWAALAVGGSLAQAIGRGRCLVQGCCHGSECPAWLGIHYHHPRSRVTRLSTLGGRPLHPTPLYSAAWMLLVTALLWRLWVVGAGMQFVVGSYFLLTGLGRFVEEHVRGEPQTATWHGFRLYQWLAIGSVVGGAMITSLGWHPAPLLVAPSLDTVAIALGFGIVSYVAYGVDFPGLNMRFSRLV